MITNTTSTKWQQTAGSFGKYLFAIPWIIFGTQHFMYAGFVATLVPAYMPAKIFWVYLTGTAMIAAGISLIINIKAELAATLLAIMLGCFILLVHTHSLSTHPEVPISWTRAIQDISLMGAAMMLTGNPKIIDIGRIIFAMAVLVLGCQHFAHWDFVTAKIPPYFPFVAMLDYLVGTIILVASACIVAKWNLPFVSLFLGCFILTLTLLYYVPLLALNIRNGAIWTGFMLNVAIAAGAFIILRISENTKSIRF
jgi:putative oxidoreductase